MSRIGELGNRLYKGEVAYDFVGRRKLWYGLSAAILLLSLASLFGRGLDLGIDFEGGSEFQVAGGNVSVEEGRVAAGAVGIPGEPVVQTLGNDTLRIEALELSDADTTRIRTALAAELDVPTDAVSASFVGPTWGDDVSNNALRGLVIFLILVSVYLSVTFEWKMAAAAMVALVHDIVITIGIYALVGFEVSPATVIGLLTILGYSLYDTVVVFDKVRENTAGITGGSRSSYSAAANLALNQTLIRSINTSIIALLPIGAILFVGAGLLGAGTLKDLALALFVGVAAGTFSSIFIATPLVAQLKEREPAMQALAARAASRKSSGPSSAVPVARRKAAGSTGSTSVAVLEAAGEDTTRVDPDGVDAGGDAAVATPSRPARPTGPRNQPRRPQNARRPSGKKRR